MLWDNEYPFKKRVEEGGPYIEWHVTDDGNNKYAPDNNHFDMINHVTLKASPEYSNIKHVKILWPCGRTSGKKESLNIYNLWGEECPTTPASQNQPPSNLTTGFAIPSGYMEVMFLGGTIDGIYEQSTGEKITPVPYGELSDGEAVIFPSMGNTYQLLYFSTDKIYRIEGTKSADMASAEIYVSIPNGDGTVEELNYNNFGLGRTDATAFSLFAGQGNADKVIHRTGGSGYNPDYDINTETPVTPPTGLAGITKNGQVQLSWENIDHPSLALVKVLRKESGYPTSPDDGVEVYSGINESYTDDTVQPDKLYYYAAYSMDNQNNYSDSAITLVNTSRFAVTGTVNSGSDNVGGARVELRNADSSTVKVCWTRSDGSFILNNLENGQYTVQVTASGYSIDNSPRSVTINNGNQEMVFNAIAAPMIQLMYDMDQVNIGNKIQITWKYRNIDNSEKIKVEKITNDTTRTMAEVPASQGFVIWDVSGPVNDNVTIKISTKSDPSISDSDELSIAPYVPARSSFPWAMFLPAINAGGL